MELDARGHGYDGKLHADRWTAEYVGSGNHALDAACFRSTRAVSWRTRTLASPPPLASSATGEEGAHRRAAQETVRELRVFYYEVQVLSTGEDGEDGELDEDLAVLEAHMRLDRRAQLMGLPSSSPSTVGATRNAAGQPYSGAARVSWRERARQLVQARVQGAEAPVRAVGGDEEAPNGASNGNNAASMDNGVVMEGEALAAERSDGSRSAWRLYQANSSGNNGDTGRESRSSPWLEAEEEEEEDPDMRYYQMLARNGNGATGSISGSGMHFAFTLSSRTLQHMRSRYERRRLRRSTEKKRYNHRVAVGFSLGKLQLKMNERAGRGHTDDGHIRADDEKIPLGHEDLGQSARSLAYIGKTGRVVSNGKMYLQCDKYGAGDVVGCGILFDSKTFFFTLNGKLMGMVAATDVHHLDFFVDQDNNVDDSSDCFASMFDWYEAEADGENDCDGSDVEIDGDGDETMSDADSSTAEDDELYPSVSLHRFGECVRTVFAPEEFKFDLFTFQKQVLKERQRSLGSDALSRVKRKQVDDDTVMDALVLDYFKYYGYEGAYEAMQTAIQAANSPSKRASPRKNGFHGANHDPGAAGTDPNHSMDQAEHSLALRSEVRWWVRGFETARALEMIGRLPNFALLKLAPRYQRVLLYCHMLCVLDVAQPKPSKFKAAAPRSPSASAINGSGSWSAEKAIACAQSVFADFTAASDRPATSSSAIDDTALRDDLALFMSILLYDDPSKLPADSRARLFLTSDFRDCVADELNSILLTSAADESSVSTPQSSLETFLTDLNALRATSLRHGCRVFPESAVSLSAQLSASRKRKEQQRRAREGDDDDDELSSGSDDSSSSASSRGGRQRHNDDDDDEEEEEEEEE